MGMLCRLVQLPHAAPNSTTRCSRAPHRIARPLFSFFGGFCLLGVLGTCRHVQTPGQDAKVHHPECTSLWLYQCLLTLGAWKHVSKA